MILNGNRQYKLSIMPNHLPSVFGYQRGANELSQVALAACREAYYPTGQFDVRLFLADPITGCEVYIFETTKCHFVTYRGSEKTVNDWANNLHYCLKYLHKYQVSAHSGWAKCASVFIRQLRWELMELFHVNADKPVVFTGHSRGGAIAEAALLLLDYFYADALITFGAPCPVADVHNGQRFQEIMYPDRTYRFVVEGDPVPGSTKLVGYEDWDDRSAIHLPRVSWWNPLANHKLAAYESGIYQLS